MYYMDRQSFFFFFSSRRRHTRSDRDWSSDVCSSDLVTVGGGPSGSLIRNSPLIAPIQPNEGTQSNVQSQFHFPSLRKALQRNGLSRSAFTIAAGFLSFA